MMFKRSALLPIITLGIALAGSVPLAVQATPVAIPSPDIWLETVGTSAFEQLPSSALPYSGILKAEDDGCDEDDDDCIPANGDE